MAAIVVCGGSIIGLSTAMLLARDGHQVTVLERDPAPNPEEPARAWETWDRKGVPQFHQPHNLFPRFRVILDAEMPELVERLVDAGCIWTDPLASLPPFIEDQAPRPGDDRFPFVTGRRPVIEAALAKAAAEHEGVAVRRGVGVAELIAAPSVVAGVPHVAGVRTTEGEEIRADLVVDASGRRTKLAEWLVAIGATPPYTESEDSGFVYNTRYFTGPKQPEGIGPPLVPMGSFSLLTLLGDNNTWSVTLWAASADTELRPFREIDPFTKVVQACPFQAHWLDGEPITDVLPMAGIVDRYRRFVVDDVPVATGVAAVGDAWACTNPSAGRGMTVGLIHAQLLRDATRSALEDPEEFVRAFDAATQADVAPFYFNQIAADRARFAEMEALRNGVEPPTPDPMMRAMMSAVPFDADVFRALLEMITCLALPQEVFARPGFVDKMNAVAAGKDPFQMPGPNREELLQLLA